MSKKAQSLATPSVLAFERKIDPSDALFYAGSWTDRDQSEAWGAIAVREKSVRGTISNRSKTTDPAKLNAEASKPNPQTVDVATLPADADTLKVSFTLRVLGGCGRPSACNSLEYQQAVRDVVAGYVSAHGFGAVAHRYATNIANGRFLWRNRVSSEAVEVRVRHLRDGHCVQSWVFAPGEVSVAEFNSRSDALTSLAKVIASGLSGDAYALLEITAFARMGNGQEVFPSQELILDRASGSKSKTLYHVGNVAGMHSQKIGNALRTIDDWYSGNEVGPIPAEPYGAVTSLGKVFRQPVEGRDFYSLLDRWVLKGEQPADDDQHYVIANLIRGGVFGGSAKE